VNIVGVISKQRNPNGTPFYRLDTEDGTELAVSMTESTTPADDMLALTPFVGKKVEIDGLIQKSRGTLMAFTVKAI
jgi:hypothetical protein